MTPTTRRKPSADRQADIVRATLDLAFEHGPERVTTGMIATRLGLTQPAIYKHFPRKRDIWLEIAATLRQNIAENIARAETGDLPPLKRIRMLVLDHLEFVRQNPALPDIMMMRSNQQHHGQLQGSVRTIMDDFRRALVGAIQSAKAAHQIDPALDAADVAALLFGIIQGQVLQVLFTRKPENLVANGERLMALLLSSLEQKGQNR